MAEWTLIATLLMMANLQATPTPGPYGMQYRPTGPTETRIERVYETEADCRAALDRLSKSYLPLSAQALRMGDHPYFNWRTGEPAHAWLDGRSLLNLGEERFRSGAPGTWDGGFARSGFADLWRISLAEADQIQKRLHGAADKDAEFERIYAQMQERWFKEVTRKMFGGDQSVKL